MTRSCPRSENSLPAPSRVRPPILPKRDGETNTKPPVIGKHPDTETAELHDAPKRAAPVFCFPAPRRYGIISRNDCGSFRPLA